MKDRFVPIVSNQVVRLTLGLAVVVASPFVAARILQVGSPGWELILASVICWLPAVYLTDKDRHKYPQRFFTYLAASHLKAAGVMAFAALTLWLIVGSDVLPGKQLALTIVLITIVDALISSLRRRAQLPSGVARQEPAETPTPGRNGTTVEQDRIAVDSGAVLSRLDSQLSPALVDFLRANLPSSEGRESEVIVLDDIPPEKNGGGESGKAALLVGRTSLNRVSRLNLFLKYCTSQVGMGGYVAFRYTPLDEVYAQLRRRYPGVLYGPAYAAHFLWHRAIPKFPWVDKVYFSRPLSWIDRVVGGERRRNRVLSRAEAWGRLAFYGMEVVAEQVDGPERIILARRSGPPIENRKPSYYAVVALEKVGLDGERIRLHKVRSMYPFSEFLQKAIFESHGLSTTGKFKNDFRITEYGKLFRRHWIDELPGLFDWLRGDIKLVGMRATSPHFLSLYPQEFYDLYIQIKPGLIPPIFDESTGGFEKIVEVEQTYLQRYIEAPLRTDVQYFWYTFRDIFLRKVRSH